MPHVTVEIEGYLKGWHPGDGEVQILQSLPGPMRRFLADAVEESPEFLEEYVVPTLQSPDPYDTILSDMTLAASALEFEELGLGTYESNLGDLGKSFFKRLKGALKKSLNPVKAIKGTVKFTERQAKKDIKHFKGAVKGVEKIARKYGAIILTVVGAVLGPFTGGASVAAAAILIAAQKAYQAHAAAQKAKRVNRKEAAAMQADAAAQTAQVESQVDSFYSQNQQWFETQLGVTPDKWAKLTLQQKIDLINAGSTGQVPSGAVPPNQGLPSSSDQQAQISSQPSPVTTPSIYGSGGPPPAPDQTSAMNQAYQQQAQQAQQMPGGGAGADWSQYAQPAAQAAQAALGPQDSTPVSQSSMFGGMSGMLLPAAVVTAAVIFSGAGGKGKGGRSRRKSKRNPHRRRSW